MKTNRIKCLTLIAVLFLLAMFTAGCGGYVAPEHFTQEEKIQFTTLKTLKSAKVFREFALGSAGSLYKQGLMDESTKERIIELGDDLQMAINTAADALSAYKKAGGLGSDLSLSEKIVAYQAIFNRFMEAVTPYVMGSASMGTETSSLEVI